MPHLPASPAAAVALILVAVSLSACRDFDDATPNSRTTLLPTSPQAATVAPLPGRSLAANCFQCHGTDGNAGELKIAGESASEIVSELNSFRAKNPRSNIMNVHALGYTQGEIALIADYFSQQGH